MELLFLPAISQWVDELWLEHRARHPRRKIRALLEEVQAACVLETQERDAPT